MRLLAPPSSLPAPFSLSHASRASSHATARLPAPTTLLPIPPPLWLPSPPSHCQLRANPPPIAPLPYLFVWSSTLSPSSPPRGAVFSTLAAEAPSTMPDLGPPPPFPCSVSINLPTTTGGHHRRVITFPPPLRRPVTSVGFQHHGLAQRTPPKAC
jgi:hypothetical protein